jgi:hypothetical protein
VPFDGCNGWLSFGADRSGVSGKAVTDGSFHKLFFLLRRYPRTLSDNVNIYFHKSSIFFQVEKMRARARLSDSRTMSNFFSCIIRVPTHLLESC